MKTKRTITYLLLLTLVPLSFYGYWSWFYSSDLVFYVVSPFCLFLGVWLAILTAKKKHTYNSKFTAKIRKPFLTLGVLFFAPLLIWFPLGIGLPAIVSTTFPPNETISEKVVKVSSRFSRRACDNRVFFKNTKSFLKDALCVSEDEVSIIKPGETVDLLVNKSSLGIRIYAINKK